MTIAVESALHFRPGNCLDDEVVSRFSKWGDVAWRLDNLTPGSSNSSCTIRWDVEIAEGERLTDATRIELLDALKKFVWSLFADRRRGRPLKPGTLGQVAVGLRILVRWIGVARIVCLSQLTADNFEMFVRWLSEQIVEEHGEEGLTEGRFMKSLSVWAYLWEQSGLLAEAGMQHLPHDPFCGVSCLAKCQQLIVEAPGRIPPLPDELAIPISSEAWEFLGQRADDIIELQQRYFDALNTEGRPRKGAKLCDHRLITIASEAICSFRFSILPGTPKPWREQIEREVVVATIRQEQSLHGPVQAFRNLILDVRDAATIILQGGIGLRSSEICGLRGGWNGQWPASVELQSSVDGLLEIFYLKGILSKGHKVPKPAKWVMGCRPAGSEYVPPTVRAIIVLQNLLAPWREMGGRDSLLVSFSNPHGLPKRRGSIAACIVDKLASSQKNFILRNVQLPIGESATDEHEYSKRRALIDEYRPHRWRKSFAQFVYRTNPSLIRALSKHFKHMSIAMTEKGYVGNDIFLEADLRTTRQRLAAQVLYEMVTGKRPASGPLARLVAEHRKKISAGATDDEEVMSNILVLVRENDIRVQYAAHGKCFVSLFPLDSRCHQLAGTLSWDTSVPNFSVREPSVCLGCKCYAIDPEHEEYWVRREQQNRRMHEEEESAGRLDSAYLFLHRASQANAIVTAIGGRRQ